MRSGKRTLLVAMSGLAILSLLLAAAVTHYTSNVQAASGPIPDDGQVHAQFSTGAGAGGFRTTNTIPYWSSSFTFNGTSFPFTMVGTSPFTTDATTTVPTVLIPLKFVFSPKSNLGGGNFSDVRDPFTVDPVTGLTSVQATLDSPIFQTATYPDGVGTVQFGDAIQRATFDKTGANGYHVLLGTPTVLPEVTFNVPANLADVHRISARIDIGWFSDRLNELMNSLHLDPHTLPIFATYNTLLYTNNNPAACCVLGFHGAPRPQCPTTCAVNGNGAQPVQTFIYESWLSAGVSVNPGFQDNIALSHEVSEWLNDPFTDNLVPPWLALGPAPFCQGNLETGDVLEELDNAPFSVNVNGLTFHVQSEALLPWFERQSPSTAVAGAYSYPDTTLAPTFAQSC
ncbi:MAG TPA: hypothetical protein VJQ45_08170 [Ktedonobacterales bacterium]|nr:hypothetical protein [Ktedonobacterales bacterium]